MFNTEKAENARLRNVLALMAVSALLVTIDQVSKIWAVQSLKNQPAITLLPQQLLLLTYAENSGAFLSLGANLAPGYRFLLFSLSNGLLLGGLLVYLFCLPELKWFWKWGCVLLLAGGLGNFIDRLLHAGHVIDFLFMKYGPLQTGIFNIADLYVTTGFLWLGYFCLLEEWQGWKAKKQETSNNQADVPSAGESTLRKRAVEITPVLNRTPGILPVLFMTASCAIFTQAVRADQVIYRVNDRGAQAALTGEILEYTAEKMEFRVKAPDTIHTIPESSIISYQAFLLPDHQQAIQALQIRNYADAYQLAEKVLPLERRAWVRRELWSLQVQSAMNQQQWSVAGRHFRQMIDDHTATRHQDLAPLLWSAQELKGDDRLWAERELNSSLPLIQLIAASWLLEDSLEAKKALKILEDFLYSPEPVIRGWARCQLWRKRLTSNDFNEGELPRWESQLRDLPVSMRAGPMFVLAKGYEQMIQPQRAAACYLWIPIEDSRRLDLAAPAQEKGADLLEKIGQVEQAARLRTEARLRFGQEDVHYEASPVKPSP